MHFVLILFWASAVKGTAVTSSSVPGFTKEEACIAAGEKAKKALTAGTYYDVNYTCIAQ